MFNKTIYWLAIQDVVSRRILRKKIEKTLEIEISVKLTCAQGKQQFSTHFGTYSGARIMCFTFMVYPIAIITEEE